MQAHPVNPAPAGTWSFVRLPVVMQMTGLGRSTIYRLVAQQQFPKPVRVAVRAVAWRRDELDTWCLARPRAR